jgi:hypothetical protein
LLADAERLRERIGDEQFFAGLNGEADIWSGVLEGGRWDVARYLCPDAGHPAGRGNPPEAGSRWRYLCAPANRPFP